MFEFLLKRLPTNFLDDLYDAVFSELISRGHIVVPEDGCSLDSEHEGYRIKLVTEIDNSFTTTWQVYDGDELICGGNGEFHSSVGEAEYSAMEWINVNKNARSVIKSAA